MAQTNETTAIIMLSDDASAASHSIAAGSEIGSNQGNKQVVK